MAGVVSGRELGIGDSNLEQHACQDQISSVARATVAEATAGQRETTPIVISSSQISSDSESLRALIKRACGKEDASRLSKRRELICGSSPHMRRQVARTQ